MASFDPEVLWTALERQPGGALGRRYCVAFSGGLDSTVLLAALTELRPRLGTDALRAVHVDHGLHPDSHQWAQACQARCRTLNVPLEVLRVNARALPGESPEARAREARYAALRAHIGQDEALLTAHHADDQLETVLLQLLRGAGVAGMAAMPTAAPFGHGRHLRPLLEVTRAALLEWARGRGLGDWVEDPANEDLRLSRNHLRAEVLPAVRAHWPGAAVAAARTARHCAEAAGLLAELAELDVAQCLDGEALALAPMRALSPARCRNLVRWQARRLGLPVPDERRLATLLAQVFAAAPDASPQVSWPGVVAMRHGGRLWLIAAEQLRPPIEMLTWKDPGEPLTLGQGLGRLSLEPSPAGGLCAEALAQRPWRVVSRRGGERLRLPGREGTRSLKKLMHAAGVPPWWRARMPLVEINGQLAAVGDLWIDAAWWAPSGVEAWRLSWQGVELPGRSAFVVGEQAF